MAKRWDSVQECRHRMQEIRMALGDYHNRRGGPVYGMRSDGTWREIQKAALRRGIPEGWDNQSGDWFVLRRAEVRGE
jgi:hypothetical protein